MRAKLVRFGGILLSLGILSLPGIAQQSKGQPPLSPPERAICRFSNGRTISINYSSPRMRGRKIFGGLVPYGQVWRVGANEATTFDTTANLMVGDKQIPAGNYTLFAIPNSDSWTLIISKKTGEWGIPYPGENYDFVRIPMTISKLPSPVEDFTISLVQSGGTKCTMQFDWETTRASIAIKELK